MGTTYALIADIISSRTLPNRAEAQEQVEAALRAAADRVTPLQGPWATTGDEFQALVSTLTDALTFTLWTQLNLPAGIDLRFGIGAGWAASVGAEEGVLDTALVQDGSAWWSAREAIDHVHHLQDTGRQYARTHFHPHGETEHSPALVNSVNSCLALRDHVVTRMRPKERRITRALMAGHTQVEVARAEKLSQAAISQAFQRSGGTAVLDAHRMLMKATGDKETTP